VDSSEDMSFYRNLPNRSMHELVAIAQVMDLRVQGMSKSRLIREIEGRLKGQPSSMVDEIMTVVLSTTRIPHSLDLTFEGETEQEVRDFLYGNDPRFVANSIIALRRGAERMLGFRLEEEDIDIFGSDGAYLIGDGWDVLQNYAEMEFPEDRPHRGIIDASYDPAWRQGLREWAQENADLLRDTSSHMQIFDDAAALDLERYINDFSESSHELHAALAAGRLPFAPDLAERSRELALLATRIWRATSSDSPMLRRFLEVDPLAIERVPEHQGPTLRPSTRVRPGTPTRPRSRPQVEGAHLEASVLDIFKRLFRLDDDEADRLQRELRRQRAGTQFGADIIFRASAVNSNSTCLVECKNYAAHAYPGLPVAAVADKVLQAEASFDAEPVDHWILISPHLDPNNELDRLIQRWNAMQKFPFTVQVWSPQSGVRDLFATVPEIYRSLYNEDPPELQNPDEVLAAFSERLRPPIRLPSKLNSYLKDARSFVEPSEQIWLDQLDSQIERYGFDEKGARLTRPLQEEVLSVLLDSPSSSNVVLLLADFGEGKSFFSVSLCVRLQIRYLREPKSASPIPVRFFLRGYRHVSTPLDFLRDQLALIGLSMEEWAELRRRNILVVLDGMDEMSVRQDPATIRSNLDKIGSLLEELDGLSVFVTSRPHFFSSGPDRERFYDRLRRPHVFFMGQPDRRETVAHLRAYADSLALTAKLNKIKELYDPIGLAGKVLFMEMIKKTLPELPEDRFDELVLYETYVKGALQRKIELLRDPGSALQDVELRQQLEELLEKIAIEIHVTGEGSVDLRNFVSKSGGAAQLLWRASQMDGVKIDEEGDATARIGSRSLLRRVAPEPGAEEESWLVDFFHRSMKEYFVAKALRRALNAQDPFAATRNLLIRVPIQQEIVSFFKLLAYGDENALTVLGVLAHSARVSSGQAFLGGGAISLYYASGGQINGSDWRSLQLDGALLGGSDLSESDLRNSSLRRADLSSTDLTAADLRWSDLSDANLGAGGSIVALSQDVVPRRYLCLTQECGLGRISINPDDSLKFSFTPLPRTLRWPEQVYILSEDIVLIVGRSEFLIAEISGGTAEEVTHFRVASDLRSAAVVDQALLGMVFAPELGAGKAILTDITSGEVIWSIPIRSGGRAWYWSRVAVAVAYDSEVIFYRPDKDHMTVERKVIETELALSGSGLAYLDNTAIVTTDDGRVSWLRSDESTVFESIQAHSGAGTAMIAANGDILSAGSDGSVVLIRQERDATVRLVSRLERRLRCARARVEGLRGVRERDIFLANGADAWGSPETVETSSKRFRVIFASCHLLEHLFFPGSSAGSFSHPRALPAASVARRAALPVGAGRCLPLSPAAGARRGLRGQGRPAGPPAEGRRASALEAGGAAPYPPRGTPPATGAQRISWS
jgi:Pentapeptide repeats (8 copies)